MLTTEPAAILGVEKDLGTLEVGKVASFIVASGDLFAVDMGELKPAAKKTDSAAKVDEVKADADKPSDKSSDKSSDNPTEEPRDRTDAKAGEDRGEKKDAKKPRRRSASVHRRCYEVAPVNAGVLAGVWDLSVDMPAGRVNDGTIEMTFTESGELTMKKTFTEQKDEKGKPKVATVKPKGWRSSRGASCSRSITSRLALRACTPRPPRWRPTTRRWKVSHAPRPAMCCGGERSGPRPRSLLRRPARRSSAFTG